MSRLIDVDIAVILIKNPSINSGIIVYPREPKNPPTIPPPRLPTPNPANADIPGAIPPIIAPSPPPNTEPSPTPIIPPITLKTNAAVSFLVKVLLDLPTAFSATFERSDLNASSDLASKVFFVDATF